MSLMESWHHLKFKGAGGFAGSLVGVATNNYNLVPPLSGCLWELRHFYYFIMSRDLHKWLSGHGRAGQETDDRQRAGTAQVQKVAQMLLYGVPAVLVPSSKSQARSLQLGSVRTGAVSGFQEHMVSSGWLLAFVLMFAHSRVQQKHKELAMLLFEDIVATACGQDDLGTVQHLVYSRCAELKGWRRSHRYDLCWHTQQHN